jgi:hypothetical protein
MSSHSLEILNDWFRANSSNPYASASVKADLANKTGLTIQQVTSWLHEARKRYKKIYKRETF